MTSYPLDGNLRGERGELHPDWGRKAMKVREARPNKHQDGRDDAIPKESRLTSMLYGREASWEWSQEAVFVVPL